MAIETRRTEMTRALTVIGQKRARVSFALRTAHYQAEGEGRKSYLSWP